MQSQEASNLITIPKLLFREGDGREGDGSMEQKSIIPKVYTHIFCVSHPNGFAIDHYCGRAFLHLILLLARQASVLRTLSMHYKQRPFDYTTL